MCKWTAFICWTLAVLFLLSPLKVQAEGDWTDEEWVEIYAALESGDKQIELLEYFRVMVDPNDLNVTAGLDSDWLNILLLGTDSDFNKMLNGGSSDLTIIASINVKTGEIRLTSLVRDMYVNIPGINRPNRLNVTNAFGGPLLAIKTVNTEFGMNIEDYCSINFRGYIEVIDMLGGVELTLSLAEAEMCGALRTTEPQTLSGEQALAYSRIHRVLGGNFEAADRNKNVLQSIIRKLKSGTSIEDIIKMITVALGYMDTNLTVSDIITLTAAITRNKDLTIETLSLPQDGDWQYAASPWGQSVVTFDRDTAQAALYSFIYNE
jgi:LCP family protein required for cell wall assembly